MKLDVTFRNLKPRDEVRRRAQALYDKLSRFLDASAEAKLTIGIEAQRTATVELVVTTRGQTHKVEEQDAELRTALDRSFHTLEMQLRRAKERRVDRRRSASTEPDGFVEETTDERPTA